MEEMIRERLALILLKEKDVNLQIAMKTKKLLEEEGVRVIMTRDKDQDLAGGLGSQQKSTGYESAGETD